jgi:hypothetical protein
LVHFDTHELERMNECMLDALERFGGKWNKSKGVAARRVMVGTGTVRLPFLLFACHLLIVALTYVISRQVVHHWMIQFN